MTEQSPNYLPEDARPAALRLAEFVLGWAGAWPTFSNAHKLGMETAAELLRLHTINHDLATKHDAALLEIESLQKFRNAFNEWHDKTEWVQDTSTFKELGKHRADVLRERILNLEAQLAAIGAGGVEPLRKVKCLHQITEPAQQEQKPVAWRGGPAPHFLGRYQYTNIGLQAEAWEKQGLQVEPLFATPQPVAGQEPQQLHGLESLALMARAIFHDCYPTETQRAVDEVIEWLAASIRAEMDKVQSPVAAQPIPSNPGELELKSPTNIDSPFNACMYQEHCKRWRDAAVRQPPTA